jgi:hypothetical protein
MGWFEWWLVGLGGLGALYVIVRLVLRAIFPPETK